MSLNVHRIRVVIADDTEDIRLLVRANLELDGRFEVVGEAADGESAIGVTEAHQPDLVVLDLAMPAADGLQAIPEIRKRSASTRIAVLSGFSSFHVEAEALRLGADCYLEKGTPMRDVAAVLAALCETDAATPAG